MSEAAERALVSVATTYRYFRTAEDLWEGAALYSATVIVDFDELEDAINAAGDDVDGAIGADLNLRLATCDSSLS
jgi:AcrR family transcriptional regulator